MPHPIPSARGASLRLRRFLPLLELLEARLPPGGLFLASRLGGPMPTPAPAAAAWDSPAEQRALLKEPAPWLSLESTWHPLPETGEASPVARLRHEARLPQGGSLFGDTPAPRPGERPERPPQGAVAGLSFHWAAASGVGPSPSPAVVPIASGIAVSDSLHATLNRGGIRLPPEPPVPPPSDPGTQSAVNLSVTRIEVTQAVQRPDNSVGLVAERPTLVRVFVGIGGATTPIPAVTAMLFVLQDYVEIPGGPLFPINDTITAKPAPDRALENDTLNFLLPPLAGNVQLAPLVYTWEAEELDWGNNGAFYEGFDFACRRSPSLAYVATDYRPGGGGSPNLPNPAIIAPGVGDAFVKAMYPIPYVDYYEAPGGPLIWTMDINNSVNSYLNALNQRRQLTAPTPDVLYGWLPGNPFNGNGAAVLNGHVSFGNTEQSRYVRTFAHEVGHNFGLNHNGRRINEIGVDVDNSIGLGVLKPYALSDIMVGGLLTHEAFVDVETYTYFYNHPWTQCSAGPGSAPAGGDYLFVTGLIDAKGHFTLNPSYVLPGATTFTVNDPTGEYLLRAHRTGGAYTDLRFSAGSGHSHAVNGDAHEEAVETAFALVLPHDPGITRLEVLHHGMVEASQTRSTHAPQGGFAALPAVLQGATTLAWTASDPDGDTLTYSIQYSPDGGTTLIPVAVSVTSTQWNIQADYLTPSTNGFLRLLITDGFNTTVLEQPVTVTSHHTN